MNLDLTLKDLGPPYGNASSSYAFTNSPRISRSLFPVTSPYVLHKVSYPLFCIQHVIDPQFRLLALLLFSYNIALTFAAYNLDHPGYQLCYYTDLQ